MPSPRRHRLALVLATTLLSAPVYTAAAQAQAPAAAAPDDAAVARARELFQQGLGLAAEERWAEAAAVFEQARAITPRPSILFNLASVLYRVGSLVRSQQVLAEYLERAPSSDDNYEEARRLRGVLDKDIPTLELTLAPITAVVLLDATAQPGGGARRTLSLDPGDHHLEVRAEGHQVQAYTVTLARGERRAFSIELVATPAPPPEVAAAPSPPPEPTTAPAPEPKPAPAAAVSPAPPPRDGEDDGGLLSSPLFWVTTVALVGGGAAAAFLLTQEDDVTTADASGGSTGVVLRAPGM